MTDLLLMATLVAFFALMIAFVRLCERIVGKDEATDSNARAGSDHTASEEVPA